MVEKYANPARFETLAKSLIPITACLALVFFAVGLYIGLFASPPDYQQKETVRIMYIHVPAAWFGMGAFFMMGICSALTLIRRHHLADCAAKALAPIGATFTLICLVTGSLWGRPTWGTYWIWDARLTSMLILFFIYIAYMLLRLSITDRNKSAHIAAIFCLVGLIDLPIIKFSVEWWNTLHQGASVMKLGKPSIHISMLIPLVVMSLGYLNLLSCLTMIGMKTELNLIKKDRILRDKITKQG